MFLDVSTWRIYIGYTMKRRGIQDLDHRRNWLFRRPKRVARGCLIRFPRWSKFHIPRLFHRIRCLYYTSLSVCLSVTAKYCSRVLEAYRSRQDCRHRRPTNIVGQHVVWMITSMIMLVIALLLRYFPVVEPLDCLSGASAVAYYSSNSLTVTPHLYLYTFKHNSVPQV